MNLREGKGRTSLRNYYEKLTPLGPCGAHQRLVMFMRSVDIKMGGSVQMRNHVLYRGKR